jgi:hypothetical protein
MENNQLHLVISDTEQRMIVKGLYDLRAQLLLSGEPADDIEALMLRIMDAQSKAERRRSDREAR